MNRFSDKMVVVLEGIDEEQEKEIDKNKTYIFKNFFTNAKYAIGLTNVLFYGEINIDNEEDIRLIKKFNCVPDSLGEFPGVIPSTFDYASASSDWVVDDRHPQGYRNIKFCTNPIDWFKYCHCEIGKPKRVIAFKTYIKFLDKSMK